MKVEQNKVVNLTFNLTAEGESVAENQFIDYIQGTHMLLPMLELAVEGLEEGDDFSVNIPCEEAYGPYDASMRFDIPKESFRFNGEIREDLLEVGRIIPMMNQAGEVCRAIIIEVKENDVTVDFNHPLAGKALHFSGKIDSVREATEKELKEGLHGEFLPPEEHHCCGGGCHGGCGGGDHEGCCGGEGGCNCHGEDGAEGGCCGHCHEN